MKLKELKNIIYSSRGNIINAVLYDTKTDMDVENATIDYIIENHENDIIKRITIENNTLILWKE